MTAIPAGDLGRPLLKMGPHQFAQLLDLPLGIELRAKVQEVHQSSQAEADDKMLAEVERQQPTSVLLRKPQL